MLWPEAFPSATDSHRMRALFDGLQNMSFFIRGYNCFHTFGTTIKTELIIETRILKVYIGLFSHASHWGNKTMTIIC